MSGLKEKIAEAVSKHISLDDTYTYELTRVKTAFEVGNMSLEDFEEWSDESVDDLAGAIVDALQPELNDNQKIVLEWLKDMVRSGEREPIQAISRLHARVNSPTHYNKSPYRDYYALETIAEMQVLAAFAQWGLEQEAVNEK